MTTPPRTTTRRKLLRLRAALLGATVLVLASSWFAFHEVHATIDTVRTRTAPALQEAAAARAALAEADALAINSFRSGEALLAGPGDRYQNRIAVASQSLAQVAEDNEAGVVGSRQLQLVEGLLVSYTGWIAQADAHHRQGGATALAATDLWYASRLLHTPGSGILAQLDALVRAQQEALDVQVADRETTFVSVALVLVPLIILLGLLWRTQVFLRERFKREWNPPLLLATGVGVALFLIGAYGVVAQQRLETAAADLRVVVQTWQTRTSATDAAGQTMLKDLVTVHCASGNGGCGDTVTGFIQDLRTAGAGTPVGDRELTEASQRVNETIATAGSTADLEPLVPIGAVLLFLLVPLGFRARVEEYRYQPR
jgi:CHASE3 domain sensor protein